MPRSHYLGTEEWGRMLGSYQEISSDPPTCSSLYSRSRFYEISSSGTPPDRNSRCRTNHSRPARVFRSNQNGGYWKPPSITYLSLLHPTSNCVLALSNRTRVTLEQMTLSFISAGLFLPHPISVVNPNTQKGRVEIVFIDTLTDR